MDDVVQGTEETVWGTVTVKELLETLERVIARMNQHGGDLRNSEALTRYALIDPVLRALGWDTEDPTYVQPEYTTEVGRPDYVLRYGTLKIGVEAKKLGITEQMVEEAYRKAYPLYQTQGITYYVVTDGDRWVLRDISKPREQQTEVFNLQLSQEGAGQSARQLLALWRPAMPSVTAAPAGVVRQKPVPTAPPTRTVEQMPPYLPGEGIPLSQLRKKTTGRRPSGRLVFPDGTAFDIHYWLEVLMFVVKWVLDNYGYSLPMKGRSGGIIAASTPAGLREPKKVEAAGECYVDCWLSAKAAVERACYVLEKYAGISPDRVQLVGWAD